MSDPIVNIDAIPDPLKTRDQWLQWDRSNDAPRRPHAAGNFYDISWSDPDDWMPFKKAVQLSSDKESWGIGYVAAANNPDHPMGMVSVIDLDGAVDEDGNLADWVPSLAPFLEQDFYIEWSPSHQEEGPSGLHIPVVGKSVPEWWSDFEFDDKDHVGAEVLANKFSTVTGDKYEGAGDDLANWDEPVLEWLAELYENLNGEAPDRVDEPDRPPLSEERSDYDGAEWFDEEQAEEALSHISQPCSYEKWRNIGFALADHFDSKTAARLFEDWSRQSPKYDEKAEPLIEDITQRGSGRVSVGTLIHHAKEDGWNPSPGPQEEEEPEKQKPSGDITWEYVLQLFEDSDVDDKKARRFAAIALKDRHDYLYVDENENLLKYYEDGGVFERGGERHVKKVLAREMGTQFSTHDRNEILATLKDLSAVDVTSLNAEEFDEKLLCVKNGVLNLETRELMDHDPKYRFTQSIPVEYDPEAEAPKVENFLEEVTISEAEKKTLVEMIGATLHPEYLKSKFLFLFGEGSNGKGVYFELINRLLGPENVEGRGLHELANNRFAKADLHGKLANIGGDIDDRKLKNVGTIKRLTSNTDPITAEEKFAQPFKFVNSATLFFAANEPPAIDDMKRSMGRRLVPIHMAMEFVDNPDPDDAFQKKAVDKEKLLANMTTDSELSGLLNMALDGMDRLRETGDVSLEMSPMERLEFYQRFSDPIYRFANECLQKEPGTEVLKADVYEIYKSFSRAEGHGVRHDNVFWREFRRVFHFEETRHRQDDGNLGPRYLVDANLTEKALSYAPSHLAEKYEDKAESTEDSEAERGSKGLDDLEPGRHTIEVQIAEKLEPKPWQQGRGHLVDDDGNILPYVAEGSNPFATVSEGTKVQIENAKIGTDRDGLKRIEVTGVSEVTEVPTADSGQSGLDSADSATPDGGTEKTDVQLKKRVKDLLRDEYGPRADVSVAGVAGKLGAEPGPVEGVLVALATEDGLLEDLEDGYRLID